MNLCSTSAATLGLLFPISSPSLRASILKSPASDLALSIKLLRWASVALLAVNHINTRNTEIVGVETMSRIPENWNMTYMLANTDFGPEGTTKVLSGWTSCSDGEQVVHALVGVPSSQSAKIASSIANVYHLPVTGFGLADSDLIDQMIYPTFSRITPGTTPMLRALARIIKYFGWDAFNILCDDSESAMEKALELVKAASDIGIHGRDVHTHIYSPKYTTDTFTGSTEIESAIAALASAMYNSSRTRVTVFFSSKAEDIIDVLSNGIQQEIMGEGFVWLHVDSAVHIEDFADTIRSGGGKGGFRPGGSTRKRRL